MARLNGLISTTAGFFQSLFIASCITQIFLEKRFLKEIEGTLIFLMGVFVLKGGLLYWLENQMISMAGQIKNSNRIKVLKSMMKNGPKLLRQEGSGSFLTSLCEGGEKKSRNIIASISLHSYR